MNLLRKIQYHQYWNIGFCEQTPEELIKYKLIMPVKWLKHPFRDRWFADPFILRITDNEIVVLVEECPMENPKGIICELIIDRKTMRLKNRFVILELDTHLSYPAIIRHEGKAYVYPENGASGKLDLYEYDEQNHSLVNPVCILNEAVADATILEYDGHYFLSATKFPETQKKAYLYEAESLYGPFKQVKDLPYQIDRRCSRQGGNWLPVGEMLFRPSQDCVDRYGAAITLMEVEDLDNYHEIEFCHLSPIKGRYSLGLHTINYCDGLCVVDGCGYYMPILGSLYFNIRRILKK